MSDFDFDELDKAVTGALESDSADTQPSSAPELTDQSRETQTEASREETARSERAPATPPATRRSAGRFMDVVHPSSDMRTKTTTFTPPSVAPVVTTDTPALEKEGSGTKEANDTPQAWMQPLESPFLPDAKVEKRPLGTFAVDNSASSSKEDEELLLEEPDEPRIEAHTMPDPIDFAAQANTLPSENEDTGVSQPVVEEPAEEITPPELELIEEPEVPEAPKEPEVTPAPKAEVQPAVAQDVPSEPIGPASITQQYTEQPSSAPSSGAIYDTETYHKPLAPAQKKRSSVWVAIWIFLLIILGAGAGVAFYLYVLPML